MPLVGTNFYGTQVQRTPYDDAEAQRAQGLDAWNMAQHQNDWQNQRHGQSRSDARAMNRDNLNFGAWSHGQNMAQQAASAEAQRRMHEATLNQGMTLFDKSNTFADARAEKARLWSLADRESDPLRQMQMEDVTDRRGQRTAREALRIKLADPAVQAAIRKGDYSALAGADSDFVLQSLLEDRRDMRSSDDARAQALIPQIVELRRRGQTAQADALMQQVPEHRRGWIPPADATEAPRMVSEATEERAVDALDAAKSTVRKMVEDQAPVGGLTGAVGLTDDPTAVGQQWKAQIATMAAELSKQLNIGRREAEKLLMDELRGTATTGFWNWFKGADAATRGL